MVQWLRLGAFTARARVQSLVGELRSCKPRGTAKKRKSSGSSAWQRFLRLDTIGMTHKRES